MLKIYKLLIFCFLFVSFNASAQQINDLIVFCNDEEPFVLIMNGERYNASYQTNVKVTGLTLRQYKVKIIFQNKKLKEHNTTLTFFDTGYENSFALNRRGKRKYSMDYLTAKKINPEDTPANYSTSTNNTNYNTNTTNTQTRPSTPTTPTNNTNSVSVNTGLGTIGVNENGGIHIGGKEGIINVNTKNPSGNVAVNVAGQTINLNKAEKSNCSNPMNALQFEDVQKKVEKETTEDAKLTAAKSSLEGKCLTSAQVKDLMKLLSEDTSKLELSKRAFAHTNDLNNYKTLKETFTKEETKEEFLKFVQSMK